MINVPNSYAQWVTVLESLRNRDDDEKTLALMKQGTIEWQAGVAERFAQRLADTINSRINDATDKFSVNVSRAGGGEQDLIRALLELRKELAFLADVADIPALPEDYRIQYINLIRSQADSMQESLEDSATSDRSGRMLSLVRNHRVNAF